MSSWKKAISSTLHKSTLNIEEKFDQLKNSLFERLNPNKPLYIQTYRSFGNKNSIIVRGRVLYGRPVEDPSDRDSVWKNIHRSFMRFESDEVPNVPLTITFENKTLETTSDEEGYFDVTIDINHMIKPGWKNATISIRADDDSGIEDDITAQCPVNIPSDKAGHGIISDIDDTVLVTGATSFVKMAQITFLQNATMRMPFEGVAAFYRALTQGKDKSFSNPIFYVSSSPWNIYDLLTNFLTIQNIPMGPLMLRDLGIDQQKFIKSAHSNHKLMQIERILATYPELPFILIGDSGQHDPEIYQQAIHDFPDRIAAIYIRDVTPENKKDSRDMNVVEIAESTTKKGVPMLLVPDTLAAAEHAVQQGYISDDSIKDIRTDKTLDAAAPTPTEKIIDKGLPGDQ